MDETPSGETEPVAPQEVSAFSRNRTRIVAAIAAGVLVLGGLIAFLATRDSGGSGNDAAAASTDKTSSTAAGSPTTSHNGGSGPDDTTSGPGGTGVSTPGGGTGPDGSGVTDTTVRGGTTPTTRNSTGTTRKPTGTTTPLTVAPSLTQAYTAGYQGECRKIWLTADADGLMWDADWLEQGGFKVTLCYSQENPALAGSYDTLADARDGAVFDADSDMSDWSLGGTLINTSRTRTWSAG